MAHERRYSTEGRLFRLGGRKRGPIEHKDGIAKSPSWKLLLATRLRVTRPNGISIGELFPPPTNVGISRCVLDKVNRFTESLENSIVSNFQRVWNTAPRKRRVRRSERDSPGRDSKAIVNHRKHPFDSLWTMAKDALLNLASPTNQLRRRGCSFSMQPRHSWPKQRPEV